MSSSTESIDATEGGRPNLPGIDQIPLIPIKKSLFGPLVAKRRKRTLILWSVVFLSALLLLIVNAGSGWNALALGLMFPGAGFLYAGGWSGVALGIIGFIAFPFAVINWFSSGNISAVFAAWFGGALLGAWFGAGDASTWDFLIPVIPVVTLAILAYWVYHNKKVLAEGVERAKKTNEIIVNIDKPLLASFPAPDVKREMNPIELKIARMAYDKGLQPVNQWDGYKLDTEQWQMMSTRYQVYNNVWALANLNYNFTPSFTGYARDAMIGTIQKNFDKRIWGFWVWENLWGNWSTNPDPIKYDNIMVTGFLGMQLGLYESLMGDQRWEEEGSLHWRLNDKTQYRYNYSELITCLVNNYRRYDFGWYPCEPGLIYSMCNLYGFAGLALYDRIKGTDHFEQLKPRAEKTFEEEFMHPDGRVVALLFERAGFQAPSLSSVLGETAGIPNLMALWPEKAERLWHVIRQQFIDWEADGGAKLKLVDWGWDTWDATNLYVRPTSYRPEIEMRPTASFLVAAVEMGDREAVEAISAYIDKTFGPGVSMAITLGRSTASWRNLLVEGLSDSLKNGPRLCEAKYPDTLVARAVSDGNDLDLVLYPGSGAKTVSLTLDQLKPGMRYKTQGSVGDTLTADALGMATLAVNLEDRKDVRVSPVS